MVMKTFLQPFSTDQEELFSVSGERYTLSLGNLPLGCLPRNSLTKIAEHPDMTLAIENGHTAPTQSNKQM